MVYIPDEEVEEEEDKQEEKKTEKTQTKTDNDLVGAIVKQLEEKDKQIKDLNERMRETNILLLEFRRLLPPPKEAEEEGEIFEVKEVKKEEKKEEVIEVKKEVVEEVKTKNDPGGFGIVRSGGGTNYSKGNSEGTIGPEKEFYTVMLEEDTKVKNKTSVVFYLLEDSYIDGILIEKNSYLFGKAIENGNVFDIQISQVKTRSGKMISLKDVFVYDEKFSRGLPFEGTVNESVKEGTNEGINDASSTVTSRVSTSGLGVAVNAIDKTINTMTRKSENSVSLMKGYKIYIKKEK